MLYNAVVRDGAGTVYPIVGKVRAGDTVTVFALSDDGVWAQLKDGNWIATVLLTQQTRPIASTIAEMPTTDSTPTRRLIATPSTPITPTQQITATLLDASTFTTTFYSALVTATLTATPINSQPLLRATVTPTESPDAVALRNANLRRGPGTNYAVVGGVGSNEALEITAQNGDGTWLQLRDGSWIAAFLVDQPLRPLPTVAPSVIAALPTAVPTATPTAEAVTVQEQAQSQITPVATESSAAGPPAANQSGPAGNTTFVVTRRRLWNAWENGGSMDGPSVHCGQGRNLMVNVLDEQGNRINGVAVQAEYGAKEIHVTGAQGKGDGVVEFVLGSGQDIKVIRDADGTPVNSEVARGLSTDPRGIDWDSLRSAGYCQDDESCRTFVNNLSCIGHFSWTVTFERRR